MAFIAFVQFLFDKFKTAALDQFVHEPGTKDIIGILIPPDEPAFKQVGTNGDVLFAHTQAVINRTGGMTDLKAKIPQHIKNEFDDLFAMGGLLVGEQKQDIDI